MIPLQATTPGSVERSLLEAWLNHPGVRCLEKHKSSTEASLYTRTMSDLAFANLPFLFRADKPYFHILWVIKVIFTVRLALRRAPLVSWKQ